MADLATLNTWLTAAELAYHNLQTGAGVQEVQTAGGEKVRYSEANVAALRSYIADLKEQIATAGGTAATPRRYYMRPI